MTSKTVSRRLLLLRIARLVQLLEELPEDGSGDGSASRAIWIDKLKIAREHASSLGKKRNTNTPLTLLPIRNTVLRKLACFRVHSLESMGSIDTSSLRIIVRSERDRLLPVVLVQLHPENSRR